jgi:TFIIH basal transcription factor complex TTD-A subunit
MYQVVHTVRAVSEQATPINVRPRDASITYYSKHSNRIDNTAERAMTKDFSNKLASSGYLISCDVPTKQFIMHMNDTNPVDKKFIIKDLDATHLLVEHKAVAEITRKVDEWMDEVCLYV